MENTISGLDTAQQLLVNLVKENPDDWGIRKKVTGVLFKSGFFEEASQMLWSAPEIPPIAEEIVYAIKIVSKGQPSRAIRLVSAIVAQNEENAEENVHIAKILLKEGHAYQAIRFYGAATAINPEVADAEFENSLLNADVEKLNWNQYITTEEFPWDGPVSEAVEELEEEEEDDSTAELLSGATMPVPIKAMKAAQAAYEKTKAVSLAAKPQEKVEPVKKEEPKKPEPTGSVPLRVISEYKNGEVGADSAEGTLKKVEKIKRDNVRATLPESKKPAVAVDKPAEKAKLPESEEKVSTEETKIDAPAPTMPKVEIKLEEPQAPNKPEKVGVFSSFVNKFRGKSNDEPRINVNDLDLSGVQPVKKEGNASLPVGVSKIASKVADSKPEKKELPIENKPKPLSSAIAQKVERPVAQEDNGPDVLDGRTQLVSLAPEEGGVFFNELIEKYNGIAYNNLPKVATVARDMANVDYIDLIDRACKKDLGAFSQLLGLHRVMSSAGINDWVDDMNCLRKGYGDAVLATVVSKYSVSECREILNSVYAFPTSSVSVAAG
ncbi:MAG: tetratricopeptide repeat protein [Akkermansiaceae bacterium]